MTTFTKTQLVDLKEKFKNYDTDNSGSITLAEFKALFSDYLDDNQINDMLNGMDRDHNGTISFKEFLKAHG